MPKLRAIAARAIQVGRSVVRAFSQGADTEQTRKASAGLLT